MLLYMLPSGVINKYYYWYCWLGVRKSIPPVKIEWWGASMVICLEQGAYGLLMVQLMSLPPIISCFIKIHNGSTFLVPAYQAVLEKRPLIGCKYCCPNVDFYWKSVFISFLIISSNVCSRFSIHFWDASCKRVSTLIEFPWFLRICKLSDSAVYVRWFFFEQQEENWEGPDEPRFSWRTFEINCNEFYQYTS